MTTWDRIYSFFRQILNPINTFHKLYLANMRDYKQPRYLNNLYNPNMNNVTSLDYSNYTQTQDIDGVLNRWSTEYPRLSLRYQSKADEATAPWGNKSKPVRFDLWEESSLVRHHSCANETTLAGRAFERGVWYYSGLELIDHHDISGFENVWSPVETFLGRETRPQLLINTLNRLRSLDYSTETTAAEHGAIGCCSTCRQRHAVEKEEVFLKKS